MAVTEAETDFGTGADVEAETETEADVEGEVGAESEAEVEAGGGGGVGVVVVACVVTRRCAQTLSTSGGLGVWLSVCLLWLSGWVGCCVSGSA